MSFGRRSLFFSRLAPLLCALGVVAGCAWSGAKGPSSEEIWGISDSEYSDQFDESILDRQQPFTRTELNRVMSDGHWAVGKNWDNVEEPLTPYEFLLEERNWDQARLDYILTKIRYILAHLQGRQFTAGEARFYAALQPTPQEVGMVNSHLEVLLELLPRLQP